MRDLASRLRAIVQDGKRHRESFSPEASKTGLIRELSYVSDTETEKDSRCLFDTARDLGGEVREGRAGTFIAVDRVWDATDFHGPRRIASYRCHPRSPIEVFDPRLAGVSDWSRRPVFFDIETTGLSGGAGTVAFLVGVGWFEDGGFRVRQFLMTGPGGEPDMLDALDGIFDEASLLVTYNGRTFDVPTMETRWAFHRRGNPAEDLPHFDMLPAARRLWSRPRLRAAPASAPAPRYGSFAVARLPADDDSGCSLTSIERSVLGFHRVDDVPGFEIPVRYFQFLRTGRADAVRGVLEHNQHDIVSLAAVTAHALQLAEDGPEACRHATEQSGLGRLYERAGDPARAERAYELAGDSDDVETAVHALSRLAVIRRRADRHPEAAAAWQRVIERCGARPSLRPLATRAAEALAIHHEHRARDLTTARDYAETLRDAEAGRRAEGAQHRIDRIDRKIQSKARATDGSEDTKGGPGAALFE